MTRLCITGSLGPVAKASVPMVAVDSGGQPTHYVDVRLRRELYAQSSLDHEGKVKVLSKDFIEWGVRVYKPKLWKWDKRIKLKS
jgi:hypothetical protein